MAQFEPVTLHRNGETRTAETAAQETDLRFEGWRSSPPKKKTEKSEAPKPGTPKN